MVTEDELKEGIEAIKEKRRNEAAIKLQRFVRKKLDSEKRKREYTEKEKHEAATKLQAFIRSYNVRSAIKKEREENAAATVLQNVARGFLERGRAQKQEENEAATKIQALARGFLARNRVAKQKKAQEEAEKARKDAEAKRKVEIDAIKSMLEEGFPKTFNREEFIDYLTDVNDGLAFKYDKKTGKFTNAREDDKENLKSSLAYGMHGFVPENEHGEGQIFKDDFIKYEASGISYAEYDAEKGGVDKFNEQFNRLKSTISHLDTTSQPEEHVLVKMTGKLTKPIVNQRTGEVVKDGSSAEIDTPHCLIHRSGKSLTKTFVDEAYVDKYLRLSKQELEQKKEEYILAALNSDEIKALPNGKAKDKKIAEIVRSSLREDAAQRVQNAIHSSRSGVDVALKESDYKLESLRDESGRPLKSKISTRALKSLNRVPTAAGPEGISITENPSGFSKKVTFNLGPNTTYDTAYLAIPHTPMQIRVQVAKKDGTMIKYVDGREVSVEVKEGDIIMDENTAVYFDPDKKEYMPVSINQSRMHPADPDKRRTDTRIEKFFKSSSGRVSFMKKMYNEVNIEAVCVNKGDISVGIHREGGKKPVTAAANKTISRNANGEEITFKTELSDKVEIKAPLEKAKGSIARIPLFKPEKIVDKKIHKAIKGVNGKTSLEVAEEFAKNARSEIFFEISEVKPSDLINFYGSKSQHVKDAFGNIAIVGPGETYIKAIVDKSGNRIPLKKVREEYGDKFFKALKKTKSAIKVQDERKDLGAKFREAAAKGDIEYIKQELENHKQRIEQCKLSASIICPKNSDGSLKDEHLTQEVLAALIHRNTADLFGVDDENAKGNALHQAIKSGHGKIVELLLNAGFDAENAIGLDSCGEKISSKKPMNAYQYAIECGHDERAEDWVQKLKDNIIGDDEKSYSHTNHREQSVLQAQIEIESVEKESKESFAKSTATDGLSSEEILSEIVGGNVKLAQEEKEKMQSDFLKFVESGNLEAVTEMLQKTQEGEIETENLIEMIESSSDKGKGELTDEQKKELRLANTPILGVIEAAKAKASGKMSNLLENIPQSSIQPKSASKLASRSASMGVGIAGTSG